ncbi:MAG: outer membrane lipoprotein LolB [Rhodoferax sp.]|jgi:outer membrane lipoprotein LolB|nr:outer membrane lipoprotein LolB [Rhodoferax sp.]
MTRRSVGLWVLLCALVVSGCATPAPGAGSPDSTLWAGRLSVRVDSEPVQSFAAGFELRGDLRQGRLSLFSPFGATLAQLTWSPLAAQLQTDGKEQSFASLDALTRHVAGTELPIAGIFAWLRGQPAEFGDWTPDVQERAGGRLVARRLSPLPAVEMRLILE